MIYLPVVCPDCHVDMEVRVQDNKEGFVATAQGKCGKCGAAPTFEVHVSITYALGNYLRDASVLFLCPRWATCGLSHTQCPHDNLHTLTGECTMDVDGECPDCAAATTVLEDSVSVATALANFRSGNTIPWDSIRDALIQEMEGDQAAEDAACIA